MDCPDRLKKSYSCVSEERDGKREEVEVELPPSTVGFAEEGVLPAVLVHRRLRFLLLMFPRILLHRPLMSPTPSQGEGQQIWVVWEYHRLQEQVL